MNEDLMNELFMLRKLRPLQDKYNNLIGRYESLKVKYDNLKNTKNKK